MPPLASSLRLLARSVADFVFPPICFGCDTEVDSGMVCDSCRLLLFTSEMDVCPGCGRPCASAAATCGLCRVPLSLVRVRALGMYQEPFRKIIHALKYSEKTALAELLGGALALLACQDPLLADADAICAVPLHPARLRERGFNQSELLAAVVSRETGIPLERPLRRCKNTRTQTAQSSHEKRRENLKGAFKLMPSVELAGRRVIVVDDVCTTGATLDAAAQPLLAAGASAVFGLVVAAPGAPGS